MIKSTGSPKLKEQENLVKTNMEVKENKLLQAARNSCTSIVPEVLHCITTHANNIEPENSSKV